MRSKFRALRVVTVSTCRALGLALLIAVAQSAMCAARADDVADCESNETERIVAGCTRLIEGRETGRQELLDARVNRADALLGKGDSVGARADLAAAAALAPDNGRVHLKIGLIWIGEQKWEAAIEALSKVRQLDAKLAGEAAYHLGRAYAVKGDHANAVTAFDQAEAAGFKPAQLAMERARALAATGQRDRALNDARRVLRRDPADASARTLSRELAAAGKRPQGGQPGSALATRQPPIDRIKHLVGLGHFEQAIVELRPALAEKPMDGALANLEGVVLYSLGATEPAVRAYDRAILLTPQPDGAMHGNRCLALTTAGRLAQAAADCEVAVKLGGDTAPAYERRGFLRSKQGDLEGARSDLDRAVALDPRSLSARTYRGDVLERQGQREAAIAEYTAAAGMHPRAAIARDLWTRDEAASALKRLGAEVSPAQQPYSIAEPKQDPSALLVALVASEAWRRAIAVAESPGSSQPMDMAKLMLALRAFGQGRFADTSRRVATMTGADLELLKAFVEAWARAAGGDLQAAIDRVKPSGPDDPIFQVRMLHVALMQEASGRPAEAQGSYEQAFKKGKGAVVVAAAYVRNFLRRNDAAGASRVVSEHFAALAPGAQPHPEMRALRVLLSKSVRAPMPALTHAQGLADLLLLVADAAQGGNPSAPMVPFWMSLALYVDPSHGLTIARRADLHERMKDSAGALVTLRRMPSGALLEGWAREREVVTLVALGRIDEAGKLVERQVRATPDDFGPLEAAIGAFRGSGRAQDALAFASRVIDGLGQPRREHWALLYMRAMLNEQLKRWPAAEADFKRALALEPDQPDLLNAYGYVLVQRGEQLEAALVMLQKAVQARPEDGFILDSLGWAQFKLGRTQQAIETLIRAVSLQPKAPDIRDHLGDALAKAGEHARARAVWQAVLSANPPPEMKVAVERKLATLPSAPASPEKVAPAVTGSIVGGRGAPAEKATVAKKATAVSPRNPSRKARTPSVAPAGLDSGQ